MNYIYLAITSKEENSRQLFSYNLPQSLHTQNNNRLILFISSNSIMITRERKYILKKIKVRC